VHLACIAVIDGGGDKINIPIEKINTLALYGEPSIKISLGRVGNFIEQRGNGTNLRNVQGLVFV
jgi:hypothetical protein